MGATQVGGEELCLVVMHVCVGLPGALDTRDLLWDV